MKTGKGFRGGSKRYVKRKPRTKEVAEQIKRGDIYTGVMKVRLDLGILGLLKGDKNRPKVKVIIGDKEVIS